MISDYFVWEIAGLGTVFNFSFTIFVGQKCPKFFNNLEKLGQIVERIL